MNAYKELTEITAGFNPTITITCSTFCDLFDSTLSEHHRRILLDQIKKNIASDKNQLGLPE